ncbi:hypothetical protein MtrunA17_Chr6g0450451 [Medicago truncatula]|uniref:Uncharacterized protein n=1 Tax=Medicago truncatula TaxID=3880 RepID=A0A396HES0_MEDTR|nr:hypothetical protein MtrunA17_Chr6g0450451 [Medicago truncatula]
MIVPPCMITISHESHSIATLAHFLTLVSECFYRVGTHLFFTSTGW